ncbi:MAG: hypothetical protein ACK41O_04180 [Runella zeae]
MTEKFNIEHQFMLYLERVGLNILTMDPIQLQETRRAFYGATGQMLILVRDDVSELSEKVGRLALHSMITQVVVFWENEVKPESL